MEEEEARIVYNEGEFFLKFKNPDGQRTAGGSDDGGDTLVDHLDINILPVTRDMQPYDPSNLSPSTPQRDSAPSTPRRARSPGSRGSELTPRTPRIGMRSREGIRSLVPDELKELKKEQLAALSREQVRSFHSWQLQALSASQIEDFGLDLLKHLTSSQLQRMNDEQLERFLSQYRKVAPMGRLTADQFNACDGRALTALPPIAIMCFPPTQVPHISPQQLIRLSGEQLKAFRKLHIDYLTPVQLHALGGRLFSLDAAALQGNQNQHKVWQAIRRDGRRKALDAIRTMRGRYTTYVHGFVSAVDLDHPKYSPNRSVPLRLSLWQDALWWIITMVAIAATVFAVGAALLPNSSMSTPPIMMPCFILHLC